MKAEHTALEPHPRFVVTNLTHTDRYLYGRMYCARGDMENRLRLTLLRIGAVVLRHTRRIRNPAQQHLPAPGVVPHGRRSRLDTS